MQLINENEMLNSFTAQCQTTGHLKLCTCNFVRQKHAYRKTDKRYRREEVYIAFKKKKILGSANNYSKRQKCNLIRRLQFGDDCKKHSLLCQNGHSHNKTLLFRMTIYNG